MATVTDRPTIPMKGSLVAAFASGSKVEMWFQSPDGDSSDSQIFALRCTSPGQAEVIAAHHRRVWALIEERRWFDSDGDYFLADPAGGGEWVDGESDGC